MNQEEAFNPAELFDQYFGSALMKPGAKILVDRARPRPDDRVLDLACGTGTVARHIAPLLGPGGAIVAVDVNPGMLAVGQSRANVDGAAIEWREGDATALDLPDESFDLVLCQQGLQFFPDRLRAAQEMHRVVATGGRVVLNLWRELERHPVYDALCRAEARYLGLPLSEVASPWAMPEAGEIRTTLATSGFRNIQIEEISFDVRFPSPERFVYLTLLAAAAFLPDFDWDDVDMRNHLIESVSDEVEPVVGQYRDGDWLAFPVYWHVASGVR